MKPGGLLLRRQGPPQKGKLAFVRANRQDDLRPQASHQGTHGHRLSFDTLWCTPDNQIEMRVIKGRRNAIRAHNKDKDVHICATRGGRFSSRHVFLGQGCERIWWCRPWMVS